MKRQYWPFVFFIAVFFISSTGYWIFKNNLPPPWDQASYLEGSLYLYQSLTDRGFINFLVDSTIVLGSKAPLITILPIPLYLIFGLSHHVALAINLIFMLVFYIFFHKLVALVFDKKTALASSVIISTMPLFYGLARYFYVEFGLMTLVVIWMYLILKTKNLTNNKYIFFLGLVFGLGMLMKFHFFIFVAGPMFVVLWQLFKKVGVKLFNFKKIAVFIIPALVIAAPWYIRNILTVLWKAKRATSPELLGNLYYGPWLSLNNIYLSALDFANFVMSPYWLFVLLALTTIFVYKRGKAKISHLFLSWFVLPFLLFYLGPNKDYRLMLPLLPSIAIFIAWLFGKVVKKNYFLLLALAMVFPLTVYLNTSLFNAKVMNYKISIGSLIFSDTKIGEYVQVPRGEKWPIKEVLEFIAKKDGDSVKKVILASEDEIFNINSLRYYSLLKQLPLNITSGSYFSKNNDYKDIQQTIEGGDYLIMKLGGREGPKDLNRFKYLILEQIDSSRWLRIPNDIVLPDKGKLVIYKSDGVN